nr:hypothetical protein Itr_chr07CG02130 [Ipomoea trifida]
MASNSSSSSLSSSSQLPEPCNEKDGMVSNPFTRGNFFSGIARLNSSSPLPGSWTANPSKFPSDITFRNPFLDNCLPEENSETEGELVGEEELQENLLKLRDPTWWGYNTFLK